MSAIIETLELKMSSLLQKEVSFIHKNKIIKEGRLVLFSIKDYFFLFKLQQSNSRLTTFEIPYPFQLISGQHIIFSYKKEHFIGGDTELENMLPLYFFDHPLKYYDTEIILQKH